MRRAGLLLLASISCFGPARITFSGVAPGGSAPPEGQMEQGYKVRPASKLMDEALVWVDCEMTGLGGDGGPGSDTLLEVAVLLTDGDLNLVAEGPDLVIHHPDAVLNGMNDWCKNQFGWDTASGVAKPGLLADQVRKSMVSLASADEILTDFLARHVRKGKGVLAGNTVHMDKRFLDKFCPNFTGHLHYRLVDVSTIKELTRRWYPRDFDAAPRKRGAHRALDDIRESLQELRYYKQVVFRAAVSGAALRD
mmetsp:Transcript_31062/g.58247  ORF Transcript_31062/g.58247 Transcript_31062/m.58247 type:complete len:251 (-) Transcript_31062:38-790(-)